MANNYTTSNNFTNQNDALSSAPIWTVPEESTSTSDKRMLLSNDSINPPVYNTFSATSAPAIDDQPPNYFDISIVPNSAILHNNEVTSYTEASKAKIERNMKGVLSSDSLIDKNPDQLWLYFMTYLNEKPRLKIEICGYYTETYTRTESYTDADGNNQSRDVQETRTVTEFNFSIDLSPYICQQWQRVGVIPSATAVNTSEIVSIRDAIEQYTLSNKKLKEITLIKQIHGWNLKDLERKLIALVRSTGYKNSIGISFTTSNYKIIARSSSQLSDFANSSIVHFFCCITCLCIIFAPIYFCLRSLSSMRDKIVAEYTTMTPSDTFLQLNAQMIVNAVKNRSCNSFIAFF